VLMAILVNLFMPLGLATDYSATSLAVGVVAFVAKLLVLCGAVVVVETVNAKLRLFRVPDLLSAAFVLSTLALLSTFIFQ
jgi:formate hydrogenlyase subunit 4